VGLVCAGIEPLGARGVAAVGVFGFFVFLLPR
jgi:hypothetical protein